MVVFFYSFSLTWLAEGRRTGWSWLIAVSLLDTLQPQDQILRQVPGEVLVQARQLPYSLGRILRRIVCNLQQ